MPLFPPSARQTNHNSNTRQLKSASSLEGSLVRPPSSLYQQLPLLSMAGTSSTSQPEEETFQQEQSLFQDSRHSQCSGRGQCDDPREKKRILLITAIGGVRAGSSALLFWKWCTTAS